MKQDKLDIKERVGLTHSRCAHFCSLLKEIVIPPAEKTLKKNPENIAYP